MDATIESSELGVLGASEKVGLRERQRQARYGAILQAAFALITERGFEALTMESLAEWVGITRQTLYHHFANKDEIVLRAILAIVDEGTRGIEERDLSLAAVDRLRSIMRWLIEQRFTPTRVQLGKARLSLLPFKSRPEYREAFDRRAHALERIIIQAQNHGEVRTDVSSIVLVQMFFCLVSELHYDELIASGRVTPAEVVDSVVDTFFRGLRPLDENGR